MKLSLALAITVAGIAIALFFRSPREQLAYRQQPLVLAKSLPHVNLEDTDQRDIARARHDLARYAPSIGSSGLFHLLLLNGRDYVLDSSQVTAASVALGAATNPVSGERVLPFFRDTRGTIRPRLAPPMRGALSYAGEAHHDQTLAIFSEVGMPLTVKLDLDKSTDAPDTVTLAQALNDHMVRWEPGLSEPAFAAIAILNYVQPKSRWRNRNHALVDFQLILNDLLDQPLGTGICSGTHNLKAVAGFLAADSQDSYLDQATRWRAQLYLRDASVRLDKNQTVEGGWNASWMITQQPEAGGDNPEVLLTLTGHHLEWISICRAEDRPQRETVERALHCALRMLKIIPHNELATMVCAPTHVIRCLELAQSSDSVKKQPIP